MARTSVKRKPTQKTKSISPLSLFSYVKGETDQPFADDIPKVVSTRKIRAEHLKSIEPLTLSQKLMFEQYAEGYNLVAHGSAGCGKTFLAVYLALREILSRESDYEKLVIVRSATPVKDIGFLPGSVEEKLDVYQSPYKSIFKELLPSVEQPAQRLYEQGIYQFTPTSFVRGVTFHKSIIIMDEYSSSTFHENDSIISRLGNDCKIVFCGDITQTDLQKKEEIQGITKFMNILKHVPEFRSIEFTSADIVRGSMVKSYIMAKERLEKEEYENKHSRG